MILFSPGSVDVTPVALFPQGCDIGDEDSTPDIDYFTPGSQEYKAIQDIPKKVCSHFLRGGCVMQIGQKGYECFKKS